jgi:cell division protein FtsB
VRSSGGGGELHIGFLFFFQSGVASVSSSRIERLASTCVVTCVGHKTNQKLSQRTEAKKQSVSNLRVGLCVFVCG